MERCSETFLIKKKSTATYQDDEGETRDVSAKQQSQTHSQGNAHLLIEKEIFASSFE